MQILFFIFSVLDLGLFIIFLKTIDNMMAFRSNGYHYFLLNCSDRGYKAGLRAALLDKPYNDKPDFDHYDLNSNTLCP